jgi:diguanylate cyclase (GGDEF)-like protein
MSQVVEHLAELTGFRDRDALDVTLVGALREVLHPQCVAIYRPVGDADDERWLTRARQRASDRVPCADPLWIDLEGLPTLASHPERLACLRLAQIRTAMGAGVVTLFPLCTERDVVAVLEVETARPITREDVALVASILKVYRNVHSLLDYSERDTLTGLLNRKTFDETFLRTLASMQQELDAGTAALEMERRALAASRWWLGVIDIDHFKSVNDNHGHLIGDEVLLLLSRLMRGTFRLHDQLYRFGGEEFVVLLRAVQSADAAAAFERLREAVQGHSFPRVGSITVSVGFTDVRASDSPTGAFERADKAVYHAKQNGRNRVADHGALVAAGVFAEDGPTNEVELF